jgi:NAD(P)-dependent dehydrogenase (short-subunit alcohol dehydrogenase family)
MAAAIQNKIPVKRLGTPSDIAKLVCFIASNDGSFINGSEYIIDGGLISTPIMS